MRKELVVDINPYQTRVALVEDHELSEIYIERRGCERLAGNIYNGRVQNVLPGMQAAFIDIGLGRNAFLYAGDIAGGGADFQFCEADGFNRSDQNIAGLIRPGQELLVQVLKEPYGTKGARVTTNISLPGRTMVLMPTVGHIGVSKRIEDEGERSRLRKLITEINADKGGVIVRTAAQGMEEEDIRADFLYLSELWKKIKDKSRYASAPRLIHAEEPLVFRTLRDLFTPDIDKLIINHQDYYERILNMAESISHTLGDRIALIENGADLFHSLGLEEQIERALSRKVWLKNGGYIVIDTTEAMTIIDVNTGKFVGRHNLQATITDTNCLAAKEIARQLRLRDVSGIIIIDFIDMDDALNREKVLEMLRMELKKDRVRSAVLGITQLGLVEMTRKKTRRCLSGSLQTVCPCCNGDGRVLAPETVALKMQKQLIQRFRDEVNSRYLVEAHPDVVALIKSSSTQKEPILQVREGKRLYIRALTGMRPGQYRITAISSQDEAERLEKETWVYGL